MILLPDIGRAPNKQLVIKINEDKPFFSSFCFLQGQVYAKSYAQEVINQVAA